MATTAERSSHPLSFIDDARNSGWFAMVFLGVIVVTLAAGLAGVYIALTTQPAQPLDITACRPGTFVDGDNRGNCDPWFAGSNDRWDIAEPVTVEGQVCLDHDQRVGYTVTVGWESVDQPGVRLKVIEVPITYDPGCDTPYQFDFPFAPVGLIDATVAADGTMSFGRWRLVGRATPVDTERFLPYQWDATKTAEMIQTN